MADSYRRFKKFNVGDYVMVRMRPECFPQGTFRKLQARGTGPFEILPKVGENGYVIDLPSDWGISPTFNVEDLVEYKGSLVFSSRFFSEPAMVYDHIIPESTPNPFPEPSASQVCTNNVESIIDDQVTVTRGGNYQRYLIQWKGGDASTNTWLTREELQKLAPDLLELYDSRTPGTLSTGSSSSHPGRIDADISRPFTRSRAKASRVTSIGLWMDDECPATDQISPTS